jgi:hypothetical protein
MACKDDCWEGNYEDAKEQMHVVGFMITNKAQMMPSETDELHELVF